MCVRRFEVKMVELGKVANFVGQVAELAALAELVCAGLFAPPTLSPRLRHLHAPQHTCVTARSSTASPCVHKPTNPHGALRGLTPLLPALHVGRCSMRAVSFPTKPWLTCSHVSIHVCARTNVCILCALCVRMYVRMCMNVCTCLCVRRLPGRGGD